jgi:hypothetical protein
MIEVPDRHEITRADIVRNNRNERSVLHRYHPDRMFPTR